MELNLINAKLQRFERLAGLDETQLSDLAAQAEVQSARPGTCLLDLGCTESRQLFLLEGELELVAGDGAAHFVRHTDGAAAGPVSRLRPSRYRVNASSTVRYMLIEESLLDNCDSTPTSCVVVEETFPLDEPNELLDDSATHPLMFDVFDDLNRGRIVVPSEPEIAIRVGRSLGRQLDANPGRLSETLAVCPALTLKVLRAAKSVAREGSALRSTRAAVERLGPEKTFALAVNCILRESLRSDSPVVRGRMRAWWERTVRVAAISAYLARTSERFDPEKARLVGLLHSIGEPVMLGYAERHPDLADDDALDNVIYGNRGELGRILLTMWDLPRDIIHAATLCNHWQYEHPGEADYTDLLLVAQWHAMIGDARSRRSPSNEEIPAFARLGLGEPEPEVSIRIVDAGAKALELVDSLLLA